MSEGLWLRLAVEPLIPNVGITNVEIPYPVRTLRIFHMHVTTLLYSQRKSCLLYSVSRCFLTVGLAQKRVSV